MSVDPRLQEAAQFIQAGDRESARSSISAALRSDPQNAEAWYLAAYLSDDTAKRIQALERALSINPLHEKAQKALTALKPNNAIDDFFSTGPSVSPMPPQAQWQPVVNVHVTQANTNQAFAGAGMAAMPAVNGTAFWIGMICATFLCIFGVSHLINGKIGGAIGAFLIGTIAWPIAAVVLVGATGGLCAIVVLPLHIYLAYTISKRGATNLAPVVMAATNY